jgi:hypothetical protein
MMRYHWGLGVGHYYAHQPTPSLHDSTSRFITDVPGDAQDNQISNLESEGTSDRNVHPEYRDDDLEYVSDDPELGLEDRHLPEEGWQDAEPDGTSDGGGHSGSDSENIEDEDYTGL